MSNLLQTPAEAMNLMRVRWKLLTACNYDCDYCCQPQMDNFVILRERMLGMAYKILTPSFPAWHITLTGGEPTLHPALPEIVRYFLSSRRNVAVSLESNGSQSLQYYRQLFAGLPAGRLRLVLSIHPFYADIMACLLLIAAMVEGGQHVRVKLFEANSNPQYLASLVKLRNILPFELEFVHSGNAENTPMLESAARQFAQAEALSPDKAANALFLAGKNTDNLACCGNSGIYRTQGPAYLQIEPDGSFYSAACRRLPNTRPLWDASDGALDELFSIVACAPAQCPFSANCRLPRYADEKEAGQHLAAEIAQTKLISWFLPPLKNPFQVEPAIEDMTRAELRQLGLKPADLASSPLASRFADICRIYAMLAGNKNRKAFLASIVEALKKPRRQKILQKFFSSFLSRGQTSLVYGFANTDQLRKFVGEFGSIIQIDDLLSDPTAIAGHLRADRQFCSAILAGQPVDTAQIEALKGIIYDFQPRIVVPLAASAILDIPLWLKANFPDYVLTFPAPGMLFAKPPLPPLARPLLADAARPLYSILIYADSNAAEKSIDSILLQKNRDCEICLVDAYGEYKPLVKKYSAFAPLIIRHASNCDNPLNTLLKMARGKFLLFLRSGDIFGRDALTAAAAFEDEIILLNPTSDDLASDTGPGLQKLCAMLDAKPYGVAFSHELLLRTHAAFHGQGENAALPFLLRAFYQAQSVACLESPQYVAKALPDVSPDVNPDGAFAAFAACVARVLQFYAMHDFDASAADNLLLTLFARQKVAIAIEIARAVQQDSHAQLLTAENLLAIGQSKALFLEILGEYAISYCKQRGLKPMLAKSDHNWQKAAAALKKPIICQPLGNADKPATAAPMLSVIMPNYNKAAYLPDALASIIAQNFDDYELIVIDDASMDDSLEILRSYAHVYPQIRLYHMRYNVRQGICRNIGIEKARGRYVIFADSDDICQPDFFALAVQVMEDSGAPLALFASEHLDVEGAVSWKNEPGEGTIAWPASIREFFRGKYEPAPWAKICRLAFLREHDLRFPEYIYHQDAPFFYNLLQKAPIIATRPEVVYQRRASANSTIRPLRTTWLHLYSSFAYIIHQQEIMDQWAGNELILGEDPALQLRWNLENVLLEKCAAYLTACGTIPLADEDWRKISTADRFLAELLKGFAARVPKSEKQMHKVARKIAGIQPTFAIIIAYDPDIPISSCLQALEGDAETCEILLVASSTDLQELASELNGLSCKVIPNAADIVDSTDCEFICLPTDCQMPKPEIHLRACALLASVPEADFVIYGLDNYRMENAQDGTLLCGELVFAQWSAGKLEKSLIVCRKDYALHAAAGATLDALRTLLFMNVSKALVLPVDSFMESPQISDGFASLKLRLDAALNEAAFIAKLIGQQIGEKERQLLKRLHFVVNEKIQSLLQKLKDTGANLNLLLRGKRMDKICSSPWLIAQFLAEDMEKDVPANLQSLKLVEIDASKNALKTPQFEIIIIGSEPDWNFLAGKTMPKNMQILSVSNASNDDLPQSLNIRRFLASRDADNSEILQELLPKCRGKYIIIWPNGLQALTEIAQYMENTAQKDADVLILPDMTEDEEKFVVSADMTKLYKQLLCTHGEMQIAFKKELWPQDIAGQTRNYAEMLAKILSCAGSFAAVEQSFSEIDEDMNSILRSY